MRTRYKCFVCDAIVDEIKTAYDYNGGDYLKCPKCGAIEGGFSEVKEEDKRLTKEQFENIWESGYVTESKEEEDE